MPVRTTRLQSFEQLAVGLYVPNSDTAYLTFPQNLYKEAPGESKVGSWTIDTTEGREDYVMPELEVEAANLVVSGLFNAGNRLLSLTATSTVESKRTFTEHIDLSIKHSFARLGVGKNGRTPTPHVLRAERGDRNVGIFTRAARSRGLEPGIHRVPVWKVPPKTIVTRSFTGAGYTEKELSGGILRVYGQGAVRISGRLQEVNRDVRK